MSSFNLEMQTSEDNSRGIPLQVFQMTDFDWWVDFSVEDAIDNFSEHYPFEYCPQGRYPYQLTEIEFTRLTFTNSEEEMIKAADLVKDMDKPGLLISLQK